jgi:hypothetical protein
LELAACSQTSSAGIIPLEDCAAMKEFPAFMKQPVNRIATSSHATPGVEGYVFDGEDGSQMAFWTCCETTPSAPHVHDFDEYMIVVEVSREGFGMAARWWRGREPSTRSADTGRTVLAFRPTD